MISIMQNLKYESGPCLCFILLLQMFKLILTALYTFIHIYINASRTSKKDEWAQKNSRPVFNCMFPS